MSVRNYLWEHFIFSEPYSNQRMFCVQNKRKINSQNSFVVFTSNLLNPILSWPFSTRITTTAAKETFCSSFNSYYAPDLHNYNKSQTNIHMLCIYTNFIKSKLVTPNRECNSLRVTCLFLNILPSRLSLPSSFSNIICCHLDLSCYICSLLFSSGTAK